jgi:hypothetical protein
LRACKPAIVEQAIQHFSWLMLTKDCLNLFHAFSAFYT